MDSGKTINSIIETVDSEFGYRFSIYRLKKNVIIIDLCDEYNLMISCGQKFITFFISSKSKPPHLVETSLAISIGRAIEIIGGFIGKYSSCEASHD